MTERKRKAEVLVNECQEALEHAKLNLKKAKIELKEFRYEEFYEKLEKEAHVGTYYLISPDQLFYDDIFDESEYQKDSDKENKNEKHPRMTRFLEKFQYKPARTYYNYDGPFEIIEETDDVPEWDGDDRINEDNGLIKIDVETFYKPKYRDGDRVKEEDDVEDVKHNGDHKDGYALGRICVKAVIVWRK